MAQRIRGLFEKMISDEVLRQAVAQMTAGKKAKKKRNRRLVEDPEKCIAEAKIAALDPSWEPHSYFIRDYYDVVCKKWRKLATPMACPEGILMTAMEIVMQPIVVSRIPPTCCGSIRGRGNLYAIKQVQRCLKDHKASKHYVVLDAKKFYPTTNMDWFCNTVFPKLFHDERFCALHTKFIKRYGNGLPIGSPFSHLDADLYVSHAYLYWLDTQGVRYVNFADDTFICASSKRKLRNVIVPGVMQRLAALGQELHDGRNTKQITEKEGVRFLGRVIWEDHCLLKKSTLFVISRKARQAGLNPSPKQARSLEARLGLLKRTNSYNFKKKWVDPFVSEKMIRRIISDDSKTGARRNCG